MLVKHDESNRKMQDIEVAMRSAKKLKPQGLRARWPKSIDSWDIIKHRSFKFVSCVVYHMCVRSS
jgi:hypothetical protein